MLQRFQASASYTFKFLCSSMTSSGKITFTYTAATAHHLMGSALGCGKLQPIRRWDRQCMYYFVPHKGNIMPVMLDQVLSAFTPTTIWLLLSPEAQQVKWSFSKLASSTPMRQI
jgi:hypothetical protein